MITANIAMLAGGPMTACDEITRDLKSRNIEANALELLGIYDAVIEVKGESYEAIWRDVSVPAMILPVVAATTTYYSMVEWTRPGKLKTPFAYILIAVIPRETEAIHEHLKKIDEIQKADRVSGPHDIIAEVATDSIEGVVKVLEKMFKGQTGITRTHTQIIIQH